MYWINPKSVTTTTLFLVPGLLLWTPNGSVAVIALTLIYATFYCFKNRETLRVDRFDWLVITIFATYTIANLPNVITDGGNLRYIAGPSRILLCIPIYMMLKHELPKIKVRSSLEWGVIFGAIGTLAIALYQYFILDFPRVDGFLFSINFGYLAVSLAFLNFALISGSRNKTWLICGFIAASIATIFTLTRGAIFAIPLLLGLSALLYSKKAKKRHLFTYLILFAAIVVSAYSLSGAFKKRIDYTLTEVSHIASGDVALATSSGGRMQLWFAATEAFKQNPILGLNYEQRELLNQTLFEQGKVTQWVLSIGRGHAHSQYFEMLASNGIFAFLTIIMLLILPAVIFHRNRGNDFAICGLIFISGIGIFGLTEALLQANLISCYFGFFLAFFLAITRYGSADVSLEKATEKA